MRSQKRLRQEVLSARMAGVRDQRHLRDQIAAGHLSLHRAIGMWYSFPPHFRELVTNGMRCDYSWKHPGQDYLNVFDLIRDK